LHKVNGDMVMYGAGEAIRILFDLVHLSRVIRTFPDGEEARRALV
jgi:hypothetical protein